jgi:hypothetical protein
MTITELTTLIGEEAMDEYNGHKTTTDLLARLRGHLYAVEVDEDNDVMGYADRAAHIRMMKSAIRKLAKLTPQNIIIPAEQLIFKFDR